tara:strand:+ start:127 stop:489 length:363 start_codon:yes stop_codon:yes gene_type:complete
MNKKIHLSHGQQIVVPSFKYTNKIELVTPRGYALSYGDCPEEAEARATKFGHEFLACFQHPSILTADYEGKAEILESERKEWEAAQRIDQGDLVECEGREYKVKILGERYSDPVKFIPVN